MQTIIEHTDRRSHNAYHLSIYRTNTNIHTTIRLSSREQHRLQVILHTDNIEEN